MRGGGRRRQQDQVVGRERRIARPVHVVKDCGAGCEFHAVRVGVTASQAESPGVLGEGVRLCCPRFWPRRVGLFHVDHDDGLEAVLVRHPR